MERIKTCAQRFHVLADPIRLQILLLLQGQDMCVGQLAEVLGVNQPTVSYQAAAQGWVGGEARGKHLELLFRLYRPAQLGEP